MGERPFPRWGWVGSARSLCPSGNTTIGCARPWLWKEEYRRAVDCRRTLVVLGLCCIRTKTEGKEREERVRLGAGEQPAHRARPKEIVHTKRARIGLRTQGGWGSGEHVYMYILLYTVNSTHVHPGGDMQQQDRTADGRLQTAHCQLLPVRSREGGADDWRKGGQSHSSISPSSVLVWCSLATQLSSPILARRQAPRHVAQFECKRPKPASILLARKREQRRRRRRRQ